jgi:hypothetical protein
MRKVFSILALIALYDICGFCLIHELDGLALLSWFAFTCMSTLYLFVTTTKLIIMLLELPKHIRIAYVPDPEPNK